MLCYSRWCQLVAEYTTRTLTRSEDTLVALSGVATEIINRTGGTYLAGHWTDYLQIGLLWQAKSVRLSIPSVSRAPSWSWASRNGPIFHDTYVFNAIKDDQYAITSASVSSQKEDVHGKTFSGSITLKGRMKQVTKMQGGIEGTWDQVSTAIHEYSQNRELLSALVDEEGDGSPVGWGSFDTVDNSHVDTDTRVVMALCVSKNMPPPPVESGPGSAGGTSPVSLATSAINSADAAAAAPTPTFNVLLLQPTTDSTEKNMKYQRVGMGEITVDLWFDETDALPVTLV